LAAIAAALLTARERCDDYRPMPLVGPGTRIAGRYVIESEIGAGGMGVVFRARDERLGRVVAMKVLSADAIGDAVARARMLREARAGAAIDHPSLARVYDVGETDEGGVFLVMELVRGRSLRQLIREGPRSRDEVARIVSELAHALGVVHRAGIVHRDVKPDNVMIRDDGRVALLDLGLAKITAGLDASVSVSRSPLTTERGFIGTPSYMAPEQALGGEVDARADAFALGVTAYELLTGRIPWSGTQGFEILAELINWHPLPPSARVAGLGPGVDAVIARSLAKKPEERFPTVEDFAAALAQALAEPERTTPTTTAADDDLLPHGAVLAGRYRVDELRREDALCRVYDAEDLVRADPVTLDCLRVELSLTAAVRDRFEHDMTLLRGLDHPGLSHVRALGRHQVARGELVFAARDRAPPDTLAHALARTRPLPLADAERLVRQLVDALDAAHEAGVVHRGLTPTHVGLNPELRAVLSGFGLGSTDEDAAQARVGDLESVAYLAPEQVRGAATTTRTDIYALGVMMFEMVTGRLPFVGTSPISVAAKRLVDPPPAPSSLASGLDPRWDEAILRCLARDPADRFARARDVVPALDASRDDDGVRVASGVILPSSDSAPGTARRTARGPLVRLRRSVPVALGVGAVFVVVALATARDDRLPIGTPRQLTSAPGWEAEPELSPDGNLVAYTSNEKGNPDIWLIDARGGTPLQLTDDPAEDRTPSWFPDGSAIAFSSDRGGRWGIWKVARLGGSATPLVDDAIDPAISPDGSRVAFVRNLPNGEVAVWVAPIGEPTRARKLTGDSEGQWEKRRPAWSPDGKTIVYEDFTSLWRVPAEGGPATRITDGGKDDSRCAWSADGRFVYFSSIRAGTTAIWRMPLAGGTPERVTLGTGPEIEPHVARDGSRLVYSTYKEHPVLTLLDLSKDRSARVTTLGDVFDFTLAPDASALAFVSPRDAVYDLWLQPLSGLKFEGAPRRLTDLPGSLARPAFSPDGRWIAVHRVLDRGRDIWVVPTAGGLPIQVTDHPATDIHPEWSPSGSEIAFVSNRSGHDAIWIATFTGGRPGDAPRQITFDTSTKTQPTWSPDGEHIAYVVSDGDGSDVWLVEASGGTAPRRVTQGAGANMARWERGTRTLLVSGRWGRATIGLRRVELDQPARVFDAGVEVDDIALGIFELSGDGRVFAAVEVEGRGDLWSLDNKSKLSY